MTSTTEIPAPETAESFKEPADLPLAPADAQLITLGDGRIVAPARDREVLLAWGLDVVLVVLTAMGFYLFLSFTMPAPFPYARELFALAGWPAAALVYGFATAYHRSLGQLASGTRTLRISTGGRMGIFRSGWMMVLRVMILPVVFIYSLCGGSTFGIKDRHISIDALVTGL
ncbi:hypothetical protein IV500_06335 [Paeniglutamicibacter antarcticus]|uniref:RDD family protein n=1 Tax=Arthrobacter terrae TaxID=2935737 RepID=A0A931G4N9_9MICC|nr:hypothetical protein [Arthrobacter terrae]MBG0739018.1 hypothetical protein [Arthrobacter terrae]